MLKTHLGTEFDFKVHTLTSCMWANIAKLTFGLSLPRVILMSYMYMLTGLDVGTIDIRPDELREVMYAAGECACPGHPCLS